MITLTELRKRWELQRKTVPVTAKEEREYRGMFPGGFEMKRRPNYNGKQLRVEKQRGFKWIGTLIPITNKDASKRLAKFVYQESKTFKRWEKEYLKYLRKIRKIYKNETK